MEESEYDVLMELFYDSDSEEEFEGFTQADIRPRRAPEVEEGCSGGESSDTDGDVSDILIGEPMRLGYSAPWLRNHTEDSGPRFVPDDCSECEIF